jgi:hypothetical protein
MCGSLEDCQKVAARGERMLNPKTHRWQLVSKTAKYFVEKDKEPVVSEEYGENWGANLWSDEDLKEIGRTKGLV